MRVSFPPSFFLPPLDDAPVINPLLTYPPAAAEDRLKYRHGTRAVHGALKLVPEFYNGACCWTSPLLPFLESTDSSYLSNIHEEG